MKEGTKNIIATIIIALGLIIASGIYAYSQRYEIEKNTIKDKWTGTMKKIEVKK